MKKTGTLSMTEGKTFEVYSYKHVLNKISRKYIDLSISKNPRSQLSPLLNKVNKMQQVLGIGNKVYRKAFQNIYDKIFKIPLGKFSSVMAHDVATANASYLDSFVYSEKERKQKQKEINVQLRKNAVITR